MPKASLLTVFRLLGAAVPALTVTVAQAQWSQESYPLTAGWSAIWVAQDCGYTDIADLLVGRDEILEVWQWNPLGSTAQFSQSPWTPLQADAAWKVWRRDDATGSTLGKITGNSGYLIRVREGTPAFTLSLTGTPLLPRYEFSALGSNFVGFPMLQPPSTDERSFEKFFSYSEVFKTNPPVFSYRNGPLSAQYPVEALPRTTAVERGLAYWVKNDVYTDYYGPVKVTMLGSGLHFGATANLISIRLKNMVDPAKNQPVTVTLTPALSAAPPFGQSGSAGAVPLQLRGLRDPATLEFQYEPVTDAGVNRTLAPGEEIQIFAAVNRTAMGGAPGNRFQSLLNVTDSLNQSGIVLPVSAETTSYEGIWAGAAVVNTVDQVIGQQVTDDAPAPSNFTIRLLAHRKADGTTTLLQQIYMADRNGTPVASVREASVKAVATGGMHRLTSASFPLSLSQPGTGQLGAAGPVLFQVDLGYNESTNPFVHSYHPDHDNLDARFESVLPEGKESWTVRRAVKLSFTKTMPGVTDPGWGSTILGGTYQETLTGLRTVPLKVTGTFILHRVSSVAELLP